MHIKNEVKGILFAVSAAFMNGTIGVLSKWVSASDLPAASIAFFRSLIGFLLLLCLAARARASGAQGRASWQSVALCAFFGIAVLFFFETSAYRYALTANVVLTLMATATLSAFLLGWWMLGDRPAPSSWAGLAICLLGLTLVLGAAAPDVSAPDAVVSNASARGHLQGIALAAVAGVGYGAFTVLAKFLRLGGGLAVTRGLLMFGSLYLALPFAADGAMLPAPHLTLWAGLLAIALLPSIGGFYCTTRAVSLASPAQVQLFELSEPLFAAVLAAVLLDEAPAAATYIGGGLVLAGLIVTQVARRQR
ncbi:EamA family transporter [Bordetella genomosp. 1]|uniref:EamA family transporter n=1 Tax=Bordetella genomosp. 1 TaxID=1395607 RepID=A0A261SD22_9BORD|nr:DMT family transporter [Bordetella genomosp. 1]OZI35299.1 EamA family transporter [Bordetella genomosp. 1]